MPLRARAFDCKARGRGETNYRTQSRFECASLQCVVPMLPKTWAVCFFAHLHSLFEMLTGHRTLIAYQRSCAHASFPRINLRRSRQIKSMPASDPNLDQKQSLSSIPIADIATLAVGVVNEDRSSLSRWVRNRCSTARRSCHMLNKSCSWKVWKHCRSRISAKAISYRSLKSSQGTHLMRIPISTVFSFLHTLPQRSSIMTHMRWF